MLIIFFTVVQNKSSNELEFTYKFKNLRKTNYKNRLLKFFKKYSVYNLFASLLGFLICKLGLIKIINVNNLKLIFANLATLYGANLIVFMINQAFKSLSNKHEHLSWCFWSSIIGNF